MESPYHLLEQYVQTDIRLEMPNEGGYPNHMHNHYELLYFMEGDVEYTIESNTFLLQEGNLLFISPRTYHSAKLLSNKPYHRIIFSFYEDAMPPDMADFLKNCNSVYFIPATHPIRALIRILLQAAGELSPRALQRQSLQIISALLLFLKYMPKSAEIPPVQKKDKLQSILQYIQQHPLEKHTVASLSRKFFVSSSFLTHAFQKDLGIGFSHFITKNRILFAQSEIWAGKSPTELSLLCGYESYSTFYLQYKKILGHSPKEDYNQTLKIPKQSSF